MEESPRPANYKESTISHDPDDLLKLELIPPWLLRHIPKERKPGPASRKQKRAINGFLNMRKDTAFNRCRGIRHDGERCKSVAGGKTKGDFYGLGPQTGTLGVGYCAACILRMKIRPYIALNVARHDVDKMQRYGTVREDDDYAVTVVRQEVQLAKEAVEVRQEMSLVQETLRDFKKQLDSSDPKKKPTEMAGGVAVPMADATRIKLNLEIAKTLSRLNLDAYKLDSTKFVQIDHVMLASAEVERAVQMAMRRVEELVVAKQVRGEEAACGTQTPFDFVWKLFALEWADIWMRLQAQSGRS